MYPPLVVALAVEAAVAWPSVAAPADRGPGAAPAAAPRAAHLTLECAAPTRQPDRPEGPVRLTCKVHGLDLVVYAPDGIPHFWETVNPFAKDAPSPAAEAPPASDVVRVRAPGRRARLEDPFDLSPVTLLAGRQMDLELELLDPYVEDRLVGGASDLMDPFGVSVPEVPVPPALPTPSAGDDPDGMVPLPR